MKPVNFLIFALFFLGLLSCSSKTEDPEEPYFAGYGKTTFLEGQEIPEYVSKNPTEYGFLLTECWKIKEKQSTKLMNCRYDKDEHLLIVPGNKRFIRCSGNYNDKEVMLGSNKWQLRNSSYATLNDSYLVCGEAPIYCYKDEEQIFQETLLDPENYGFKKTKCWQHIKYFTPERYSTGELEVWSNGKGMYVYGSEPWHNIYHSWSKDGTSIDAEAGVYNLPKDRRYFVWGSSSTDPYQISIVEGDALTLEQVKFIDRSEIRGTNNTASGYSQYLGCYTSGSVAVDIYYDNFDINQVTFSSNVSWLYKSQIRIAYRKGDKYNYNYNYDCTRVMIDWGNNANTGAKRTGIITITVTDPNGKVHSCDYTVNQAAGSSSDGGGSGTGGEDENWEEVEATGYLPYWYCPKKGTERRYPNNNVSAYRNKTTGAYRVRWAYKYYPARKGYNKITLDTMSDRVYNQQYKYWDFHMDYEYYEFTIY